jgi:hypothetical protein
MFNGKLDSWKSANYALIVCDLLLRVEGNIEIDLRSFALLAPALPDSCASEEQNAYPD